MLGKLGLAWRRGPNLQDRGGDRKPRRRLQLELDRLVVRGMAEPRPRAVQDLRIHLHPTQHGIPLSMVSEPLGMAKSTRRARAENTFVQTEPPPVYLSYFGTGDPTYYQVQASLDTRK